MGKGCKRPRWPRSAAMSAGTPKDSKDIYSPEIVRAGAVGGCSDGFVLVESHLPVYLQARLLIYRPAYAAFCGARDTRPQATAALQPHNLLKINRHSGYF